MAKATGKANDPQVPHNQQAEKDVLGVAIAWQKHDFILNLSDRIQPVDFFRPDHQALFRTLLDLAQRQEPLTPESIAVRIGPDNYRRFGGHVWISEFCNNGFARVNIDYEVEDIRKKSRLRQHLQLANWLQKAIDAGELEPEQVERQALEEIERIKKRFSIEDLVEPSTGFYEGIAELESEPTEMPEHIIHGCPRGQTAEIVASPDGGKSTLMLNGSLCLAAALPFPPLFPKPSRPMHVVYIDFESTAAELKKDLNAMLGNIEDHEKRKLAMANFFPICDATRLGDPLSLSNQAHMKFITEWCKRPEADVVVIDTVSSGFEIVNENDNSEVRNRVMRPLRHLAQQVNAAVPFLHHDSKAQELETDEGSYRGRGASAFGALARAVFTLRKEPALGEGFVTLRQRKGKGAKLQDHLLQIDLKKRWTTISELRVPVCVSSYNMVLDAIGKDTRWKARVVVAKLKGKVSRAAVYGYLAEGLKKQELIQSKRGLYSRVQLSNLSTGQPGQPGQAGELIVQNVVQSAF